MTTRREFLKTTLAAGAISAIPAIAIAKETPVEFKPAPSNSLNDEILNAMYWRSPDGYINGEADSSLYYHYYLIRQKIEIQKAMFETSASFTITKEQAKKLEIPIERIIEKRLFA